MRQVMDYGIAIIGLFFAVKFLIWLIRYILDRNKERENLYMELVNGSIKDITETLKNVRIANEAFNNSVLEAHRQQRTEHERMIGSLDNLCVSSKGFQENHKNLQEQNKEIISTQKEISATLGRINGYKH